LQKLAEAKVVVPSSLVTRAVACVTRFPTRTTSVVRSTSPTAGAQK
jgi:hypothetical protein